MEEICKKQWFKILDVILQKINDKNIFELFIKNTNIIDIKDDILYIAVDTQLAKQILTNNYCDLIINCAKKYFSEIKTVFFLLKEEIQEKLQTKKTSNLFDDCFLNEEMTFENFIVGDSNQEVFKAAKIVAEEKKINFNPLFIYSNSGLGKTHILNAIGNEIKKNSKKKVLYTTAALFFNEYIHIIKGERIEEQFLDFFKKIDVFLIDDIHFFKGKEKCQELFFTIFSSLINKNKQIVITSDKHPNELKGLENRLITRFVGGLTVCIEKPNIETSIEIIKLYKSKINDAINIDDDVYVFIAKKFSKNIRELKGVVNKLIFFNTYIKKNNHIVFVNALNTIKDFLHKNKKNIDKNQIINTVANYYLIPVSTIISHTKSNQINLARHISMFLIRNILNISYKEIGTFFNNRKYSTILLACQKIKNKLENDLNFQYVINELKNKINSYNEF